MNATKERHPGLVYLWGAGINTLPFILAGKEPTLAEAKKIAKDLLKKIKAKGTNARGTLR